MAVRPSTSGNGQGSKMKVKIPDLGSNETRSKKRSYVLKTYCRNCQRNHTSVCKVNIGICFYYDGNGHFARNCPNKKNNEDRGNQ